MRAAYLLVVLSLDIFPKGASYIVYQFERLVNLDNSRLEELVGKVKTSEKLEDCVRICVRDDVCVAISYRGTKCSVYRSSVSRSGTSSGTITFLKHGALPTSDPCPVSEGYTSVLSPRMCYKLHKTRKTSPATHNQCIKEGGRLIILNTDEKYDYMAAYTKRIDSRPWIALFVEGKNNYEWSDGSTYIRSGAKSATKFYIGYGACGFLYRGEIRSRFCRNEYEYLCEILVA